jgi:methionine-gamma-lyase
MRIPATLTHHVMDPDARGDAGISDHLIRLSAGLEHVEDPWTDLGQALNEAT